MAMTPEEPEEPQVNATDTSYHLKTFVCASLINKKFGELRRFYTNPIFDVFSIYAGLLKPESATY